MIGSKFNEAYLQIIKEDYDTEMNNVPAETEADEKSLKRITFLTSDEALIDALNSGVEEVVLFTNAKDETTGEVVWIEKSACGAQAIIGNQAVQSTNAFKGSMSDCLKKCASLFGIALELYRDESEEEHFQMLRSEYYPDVWTEEVIAENQKDYDKLMTILESYGWSLDDISYYVSVATDNVYNSFMKMPTEYMERLIVAIQEDGE